MTTAEQRLRDAEAALRQAESQGEPPGQRTALMLHHARIALLEQRLRQLEQIQREHSGEASDRYGVPVATAWRRSGDWYIDTMDWLARAISVANRPGPPADLGTAPGLPVPGSVPQGRALSPIDAQRAKIRLLGRKMDFISGLIDDAPAEVQREDAIDRDRFEEELRAADRNGDPLLSDTVKRLQRLKRVNEFRAEQERTRADRIEQYRQTLRAELKSWADQVATETRVLDAMPRIAPAPPSTPPK